MEDDNKTKRRYRKIMVRTWSDERFRALTPIPPCGAGLWFFLLTGPHTGPIPGLFRAGRASMAEELGWPLEAFDKAFAEVFAQGMAKADFRARLVWLPKAIDHNRPESPNVVKSWAGEFDLLPECALKFEALFALRAVVCAMGEGFERAFNDSFAKVLQRAAKDFPKALTEDYGESGAGAGTGTGAGENPSAPSAPAAGMTGDLLGDEVPEKIKPAASKAPPTCPHQEIIDVYHEELPMCPRVRAWTEARQKQLRARWNEDSTRQTLDYWRNFFGYVRKCGFLIGRGGGERPFFADLEWLTKPANFVKVIEGKYE